MVRVPAKNKKAISQELKKFQVHIQNLAAKGKSSTEEDARILINDILCYVLGYDKYSDLKTEFKDKNNRLDYVVKLTEGPHAKKKDKFDFIIEAKAANVDLKQDHVNQTLTYCLNLNVDYFILTNVKEWQLFKVIKTKSKTDAELIWEVNLLNGTDLDSMTDDMYIFSKFAYIDQAWEEVSDYSKATEVGEIMAIIYSEKFLKHICRQLKDIHEVKVSEGALQDVLSKEVFKDFSKLNKSLLKRLNTPETKSKSSSSEKDGSHSVELIPNPETKVNEKIEANDKEVA